MSIGDSVIFKVSLKFEDSHKSEVRMFILPQDSSTSLVSFKEKLTSTFALDLHQIMFKISWSDGDGDDVTIGDEEEFRISMQQMEGPVYKFHVTIKDVLGHQGWTRDWPQDSKLI